MYLKKQKKKIKFSKKNTKFNRIKFNKKKLIKNE